MTSSDCYYNQWPLVKSKAGRLTSRKKPPEDTEDYDVRRTQPPDKFAIENRFKFNLLLSPPNSDGDLVYLATFSIKTQSAGLRELPKTDYSYFWSGAQKDNPP